MSRSKFLETFLGSLKGQVAQFLDLKTEAHTSSYLDASPLQDSFRFRARFLGVRVAAIILDEKGNLDREKLRLLLHALNEGQFLVGPQREADVTLLTHIRKCLDLLLNDERIWKVLRKFSVPICHKKAEAVIRETLLPQKVERVETLHVRKAALCAWLTFLRQSTGSCFATAPAILIQQSYPERFFADLLDLLDRGQIQRVVNGKEYSVPFSLNPGNGDLLRKAPYLERSLGVAVSLKEVGVLMTPALRDLIQSLGIVTPEEVFKVVVMHHLGITEDDIEEEKRLAKIRMTPLLISHSPVFYQEPTQRAKRVDEWKQKFEKACVIFRSITECSLLRTWEYTLASFADLKTEFTRWNLYIGLGIHPGEKGGIGDFLYQKINQDLQLCNREIEKLSRQCEEEQIKIQGLEVMLQGSVSEMRRHQIKSELSSQTLLIESLFEERNQWITKAETLNKSFPDLIEQYDQKLQENFQELFDPSLVGEEAEMIDDGAAGFRLVYKHGRRDASLWTAIYHQDQYIDCLREFFSYVEKELNIPEVLGGRWIGDLTTGIIQWIRGEEFITSCFQRAKAKGRRSPWDYISGGTLQMLVASYTSRSKPFTESKIVPKSSEELLQFLQKIESKEPLLMHSPTHAFIFYPDWLKEHLLPQPKAKKFNQTEQEYIAHKLSEKLSFEDQALFFHLFKQKNLAQTPVQMRRNLIASLGPQIKNKEAIVDSTLLELVPLFSEGEALSAVNQILRSIGRKEVVSFLDQTFYGPFDLYQMVKMVLVKANQSVIFNKDWDLKIAKTMQSLQFLQPSVLFADTNWSGWLFGFIKNPITSQLELWRLNRNGTQGVPMSEWKQWLSKENKEEWIILREAKEYSFDF